MRIFACVVREASRLLKGIIFAHGEGSREGGKH